MLSSNKNNTIITGKKFWGEIASNYSKTGGSKWIRYPWVIRIAGNVRDKKVLEIGCGTGTIINSLVKKGAIGVGLDYSKKMLEQAETYAVKQNLPTKFIFSDARNLKNIYGNRFDLIIISAVFASFSSISDITKVLKETIKVIKKTGTLLIIEPHPAFDHYMRSYFRNSQNMHQMNYNNSGLKYIFDMTNDKDEIINSSAYHWKLEDYASAIHESEYYIEMIHEPPPLKIAKLLDRKWYEDRSRYSSYIFIKLKKLKC